MQISVNSPAETFVPGRFYQSTSGSVLYVSPIKADNGNHIMQFYGVKNTKPSTWTGRALDDLESRGGRFELLEEGAEVTIDLVA